MKEYCQCQQHHYLQQSTSHLQSEFIENTLNNQSESTSFPNQQNTETSIQSKKHVYLNSRKKNDKTKGYYEKLYRQITKPDKKKVANKKKVADKKELGNKKYQSNFISMIIDEINNEGTTPYLEISQLAVNFFDGEEEEFKKYLKNMLCDYCKDEGLFLNQDVICAVEQVLKKLKCQIKKRIEKNQIREKVREWLVNLYKDVLTKRKA